MSRLIDADKALEVVFDQGLAHPNAYHLTNYATLILREAPTVDAVEVVHGYTIPAEEPKKVLLDRKCGICDQLMLSTDVFCPMCGTRMDGDGNGG